MEGGGGAIHSYRKVRKEMDLGERKGKNPTRVLFAAAAKSLQSCSTLCNPIDSSSPGSAVPGILQARTLEWVAVSFSDAGK